MKTPVINARTNLRLQLLNNGYTPLPNIEKRPGIPAWQKIQPDEAMIRQWGRQHKTLTTGIRLEDGLIAFDFDIDDSEVSRLFDALLAEFPYLTDALMRTGGGHKEAWMIRCSETFSRIATPVFKIPGIEEKGFMLEVFGGGSPRQFGAFGPHSEGVKYLWYPDDGAERNPTTVPLADLVEIDKAAVFAIVDFTSAWLRDNGFEILTNEGAGETEAAHEYTLTPDMTFDLQNGQSVDLFGLRAIAGNRTSCSMSWLRGEQAKNPDRGLVSLDHNVGVCIHDTMTAITYHEVRFKPPTIGGTDEQREKFNKLREKEGRPLESGTRVDMSVEARAEELLVAYAYMPSRDMAVRIDNDDPQRGQVPMKGFRTVNARWARKLPEEARPITAHTAVVNPVDFWVCHPELVTLESLAYHPARPGPVYVDHRGDTVKNYFKRAEHEPSDNDIGVFLSFFDVLIPDETERAWALDAIAYKTLHPEIPTPAVLLVDELGGVGKGILFDVLIKLMGERNAGLLPQSAVFGGTNMAGFKGDWGAKVLHCIEELPSVSEATQKEQHAMYNCLKELVDPRPRTELMPVKYGKPVEVYCCATYWMATNHVDAIPIPSEDRRIVVLTCGEQRARSYYRKIAEWASDPGNIAALHYWLAARDLEGFDNTYAPATQAKTAMIEATRYGSEVGVRDWFADTVERLGDMPPFLTVQMVLNDVRGLDPVAYISQTGTRRVNAALRRLGYRDPMHADGRHPCRWRIRYMSGGEGEQEKVLQHIKSTYVIDQTTTPDQVKAFIAEMGKAKTGNTGVKLPELKRLLMGATK